MTENERERNEMKRNERKNAVYIFWLIYLLI